MSQPSPPLTPYHRRDTSDFNRSTTPPPRLGERPATRRMDSTGTAPGTQPFDIVATYNALLRADPDLTMPVAAIEALVALLQATPSLTTISETLELLHEAAETLKRAVPNHISLSAGTDLFTRYIMTSLRAGAPSNQDLKRSGTASPPTTLMSPTGFGPADFAAVRSHLLANGRLFATRAKEARKTIARHAARFVRRGTTVLTNGGSRVVGAVLREAAAQHARDGGSPRFRVIWVTATASLGGSSHVTAPQRAGSASEGAATIAALRDLQVPVAEVAAAAVAHVLDAVDVVLVGAEGVVETGGVISRLGTYQLAILARHANKPVYVVTESHKFVRRFPLGQFDLGVEQRVLDFRTTRAEDELSNDETHLTVTDGGGARPASASGPDDLTPTISAGLGLDIKGNGSYFHEPKTTSGTSMTGSGPTSGSAAPTSAPPKAICTAAPDAVDYTPPDLLTALITEAGVLTPSAVSEELIKIWY